MRCEMLQNTEFVCRLFVEERKTEMVFPYTVNLKTAVGNAFGDEVKFFHNAQTFFVAWHNVAFYAVQLQDIPRKVYNLCNRLGGVAFALTVGGDFIGQITAFYAAEKYVGDAHRANYAVVTLFANPETELLALFAGFVLFLQNAAHSCCGVVFLWSVRLGVGKGFAVFCVELCHLCGKAGMAEGKHKAWGK